MCSDVMAQIEQEDMALMNIIKSDDWVKPRKPFRWIYMYSYILDYFKVILLF